MVLRDELIQVIHEIIGLDLLAKANQIDVNANGVQIHGAEKVSKIALGVTANLDFFEEAVSAGAEFCLFHHGLPLAHWNMYNARLNVSQQTVLKYVFAHDLTVAGYHYSLDAHKVLGNNATIVSRLGGKIVDSYDEGWGYIAELTKPESPTALAEKCSDIFDHDIFAVYAGPTMIKRIGVCSGGSKPAGALIHEIKAKQVDLHLSGEIGEGGPAVAKEAGFNYFACGHYATEVFGVQELGKKIKEHFKNKLEVEFIDIPNIL
jgi:dinuclear metal center YbgI/SA1388 family protein